MAEKLKITGHLVTCW